MLVSLLGFVRWGTIKGCERAAKEKFYQYCHVRELNPNKFPGVTLRELVDVEDIFEINVVVYALELDDQSPEATVVQLSRKKYERTMYVNLHESHFSYIFDVSKYCQRYECPRCSEVGLPNIFTAMCVLAMLK